MKKAEIIEVAKKAGIKHLMFKKDKTIKAMSSYFYRGQGGTEESLKAKVLIAFPNAEIVDTGDHYTHFIGGAPVNKQSHIYVIFKMV